MKRRLSTSLYSLALALLLILPLCASCALGASGSEETSSSDETAGRVTTPLSVSETESAEPVITEAVTEAETEPEPPSNTVHVAAMGDNVLHSSVDADAKAKAADGQDYSFTQMFDGIADIISSAGLAFVSQETVMAGDELGISGYPAFNAPRSFGSQLVGLGFDVVNIATNHMLDMGVDGIISTAAWWQSSFPQTLLTGFYTDEADYNTTRVWTDEASGIKIAFLNYTYYNYISVADDAGVWVPYTAEDDITRQVTAAKEKADVIIVSIHWGGETEYIANEKQENFAALLNRLGVDVVIGTHPYYLQRVEVMTNDEGHQTIVAYSLGNLLSGMLDPRALLGGILSFDITKDDSGVTISSPLLTPIFCHYDADSSNFRIYKLTDYSQELAAKHGAQSTQPFSYNDLISYLVESVPSEFLPEELGL